MNIQSQQTISLTMETILIGAPLVQAKTEPNYQKIPDTYRRLAELKFSAKSIDSEKIVRNTSSLPLFLHDAVKHAKNAATANDKALLKYCDGISRHCPVIWKYIRVIGISIRLPDDVDDIFNFGKLMPEAAATLPYDIKLICRYWAYSMANLMNEIDLACRIAIKAQTRLALCLFEVSEKRKSVNMAYSILMHTHSLQYATRSSDELRIAFAEFALQFVHYLNDVTKEQYLKMPTDSMLYKILGMEPLKRLLPYMEWLSEMLIKAPDSTMQVWYSQLALSGPWMTRILTPVLIDWTNVDMDPSEPKKLSLHVKKALSTIKPVDYISREDIALGVEALTTLYMGEIPSNFEKIDDMCQRRTGYNFVTLSTLLDACNEFEPPVSEIGTRATDDIQKDLDAAKERYNHVKDALKFFEENNLMLDSNNPLVVSFKDYLFENRDMQLDDVQLEERREMYLANRVSKRDMASWVNLIRDVQDQYNRVEKFETEISAPIRTRKQVTRTLNADIKNVQEKMYRAAAMIEKVAAESMGSKYDKERLKSFVTWYSEEGGSAMKRQNFEFFKENVGLRLYNYDIVQKIMPFVQSYTDYLRQLQNLEVNLENHTNMLSRRRAIFTILLLIIMGVSVLFIINYFFPIFNTDTAVAAAFSSGVNPNPGPTLAPQGIPVPDDTWANSYGGGVLNWFIDYGERKAENIGLKKFNFNRINPIALLDSVLRQREGWYLDLLVAKITYTTAFAGSMLFYGSAVALANTLVAALYDDNMSETWATEKVTFKQLFDEQKLAIMFGMTEIINEIAENRNMAVGLLLQATQYVACGGPTGFIAAAASISRIGGKNNLPQKALDYFDSRTGRKKPEERIMESPCPVLDPNVITENRVEIMEEETLAVVPYTPAVNF